jgi:hypothetical protein
MSVKKITISEAKIFHSASRHATFFSDPKVLEKIFDSVDWWGYFQGKEIACIWPIPLDERGSPIEDYFFTYYVGPMWAHEWPEFPAHKSSIFSNQVYAAFLNNFNQNYSRITSLFPTELTDIRPFIWRNQDYHVEHHEVEIKYTAKLDLSDMELILKNFRQVRRWEVKNSNLSGLNFAYDDFDIADILSFYQENTPLTHSKQSPRLYLMLSRYLALDKSYGVRSIRAYVSSTGQTVGFVLLGIHKGTVNIIVNNTSKSYKDNKSYLSTYLMYLVIKKFLDEGNKSLDFNGANGPRLADSKHSFGARSVFYFKITSNFKADK